MQQIKVQGQFEIRVKVEGEMMKLTLKKMMETEMLIIYNNKNKYLHFKNN